MTDNVIPPCGPERDRLVAEAVGWTWVEYADAIVVRCPSSSDADALAALEAWCAAMEWTRGFAHHRWGRKMHSVGLYSSGLLVSQAIEATLADAATAALVRWRNERSQS